MNGNWYRDKKTVKKHRKKDMKKWHEGWDKSRSEKSCKPERSDFFVNHRALGYVAPFVWMWLCYRSNRAQCTAEFFKPIESRSSCQDNIRDKECVRIARWQAKVILEINREKLSRSRQLSGKGRQACQDSRHKKYRRGKTQKNSWHLSTRT